MRDSRTPPSGAREVRVGRVGRPHGLDGAFVVEEASAEPERFAVGATVSVDGEPAVVVERKQAGGRLVVRFDRDVSRGQLLTVPRAALGDLREDEYYVADLVGLEVAEEGGRSLGRVAQVVPGVANDVLELDTGAALPMVADCVLSVDRDAGRITIAPGFAD
jgi:16S rRNA processing protein RimM